MSAAVPIQLEIRYDLFQKEFIIRFETKSQARAYQSKNPEGRIFADKDERDVWIPRNSSMKHLRFSSYGLAIVFESSEGAKVWRERSILAKEHPDEPATVYIKRDWRRVEFEKLVGDGEEVVTTQSGLLSPPHQNHHHHQKARSRPLSRQSEQESYNVLPKRRTGPYSRSPKRPSNRTTSMRYQPSDESLRSVDYA